MKAVAVTQWTEEQQLQGVEWLLAEPGELVEDIGMVAWEECQLQQN